MPSKYVIHLALETQGQINDAHRKAQNRRVSVSHLFRSFLHALPLKPGDTPEQLELWM